MIDIVLSQVAFLVSFGMRMILLSFFFLIVRFGVSLIV